MKCSECRELLQQIADGEEVLARSLLEQHLHTCNSCYAFRQGVARISRVVTPRTAPQPSSDFQARLLQAVLSESPTPAPEPTLTPATRLPWGIFLALAASLLVGVALYLYQGPQSHPTEDPAPVLVKQDEGSPATAGVELRESVREAQVALASLTNRTADEVLGQTRMLLPSLPTPLLPEFDPMMPLTDSSAQPLTQTGQVVMGGFQPVTDSARRAFDLFLRDLPLGMKSSPDL